MPIRQDCETAALTPALALAFQRTVSPERWGTYQRAAGFNDDLALRLYLWNAAIGQSFHFPLQTAEVALRNVVHRALSNIYGADWAENADCRNMLQPKQADDITKAERRHYGISGRPASTPQVVASLSLGFWVSLLRRKYNKPIWNSEVSAAFPFLAANETMSDVEKSATAMQNLRNRIFHQEPLIGHNLTAEYGAILNLIGWICPDMRNWVRSYSSVATVLRERPRK